MNFIQSESPVWACCKGQVSLSVLFFFPTLFLLASWASPRSGNRRRKSDQCWRKMTYAWHDDGLVSLWLGQILEADWCSHLGRLFRGPSTAELSNLWIPDMDHVLHPPLPWSSDYMNPAFFHCDLTSPGEILGQGLRQLHTGFHYYITQCNCWLNNKKHTT